MVDEKFALTLVPNLRGHTEESRRWRMVDLSNIPDEPGVYVVRYESHEVGRLKGSSDILKIGCASKSLLDRFKNYNRQMVATTEGADLVALLAQRTQKTNVRLMHFLAHHEHPCGLVVDLYLESSSERPAKALEAELLHDYLVLHGELPPLNHGIR